MSDPGASSLIGITKPAQAVANVLHDVGSMHACTGCSTPRSPPLLLDFSCSPCLPALQLGIDVQQPATVTLLQSSSHLPPVRVFLSSSASWYSTPAQQGTSSAVGEGLLTQDPALRQLTSLAGFNPLRPNVFEGLMARCAPT